MHDFLYNLGGRVTFFFIRVAQEATFWGEFVVTITTYL